MSKPTNFVDLRHPFYSQCLSEWIVWRDVYEGGQKFADKYLQQFGKREDPFEFSQRKKLAIIPGFSASAIDDVKNSIYQRMVDISRIGGSKIYDDCCLGTRGGVDYEGSSMNYFIGQKALSELLVMKRVAIYVDMPRVNGTTMLDIANNNLHPYLYIYKAEEICNWTLDRSSGPFVFTQLLLKESYHKIHPTFRVPYQEATRYRYMWIGQEDGFCYCRFYDPENKPIDMYGEPGAEIYKLDIKRIPVVLSALPHSLMKNIAKHDIALLNIESTDINFILKANFPIYTEQQDSRTHNVYGRPPQSGAVDDEGEQSGARQSSEREAPMGVSAGRAYGPEMERPGFIHPSPEPLRASMEKADQLKRDIRLLVNLALTNMTPTKQSSVESKELDNAGLESGLSFIGLELERVERQIAEIWALYENTKPATVNYPTRYNLKSNEERRAEAKEYKELLPVVPSITYQKQIAKQIARNLVGYKVAKEEMEKIEKEIDQAKIVTSDPEIIRKDVETGILSKEYASDARLYPEDNIMKAQDEHAERLKLIQQSQAPKNGLNNPGSRGVPDVSGDPKGDSRGEKRDSRNTDRQPVPSSRVRGAGNGQAV